MKKLLMLSYYFPPLGMGGTQRPAKFARYLPEFGWAPTVITVKPIAYWASDPSLLADVAGVEIVRTGSLDPQRLLRMATALAGNSQPGMAPPDPGSADQSRGSVPQPGAASGPAGSSRPGAGLLGWINAKVLPWFLLPDSKILWRWHAGRAAARLLKSGDYAAIWTTSPPHSAHLIGRRLARRFNLPWVADFRDAWAGSVVVHEPTRWHRSRQMALQRRVVRSADAVIGVTPGIVAGLEAAGAAGKGTWIPNGFDRADFPEARESARLNPPAIFTLCHCGSISRFSNPAPLLQALQPDDARELRLRFVGYDANGGFQQRVHEMGLEAIIEYSGYQPHRQALEAMLAADALVLIACDEPQARFIPGKTFEYLASRKPVLLISNVEETIHLLEKIPGVVICAPDQPQAIRAALQRLRTDHNLVRVAQERDLRPFGRKHQAAQLAEVLDHLTK